MTSRLVVGSGSLARSLVSSLSDRHGELRVLSGEENAVQTLREEGVVAEAGDVTDPETLAAQGSPQTVAAVTESGETNVAVARAAREAFADAFVLAYAGRNPTAELTETLSATADRVFDPGAAATASLRERIGDAGVRTRKLLAVLRDIEGSLAVVTHDNPDPDAIASAVALAGLAARTGLETEVCYFGEISHQENRAFVNLLEFDLHNLDPGADLAEYDGVALVDHSQPGVNDGLPEETPIDIVVDHHPPRLPVEARFVDLRSEVGATSTLLVDYYSRLGIDFGRDVATGLLFGIHVDTDAFTREVSADDFEAAAALLPAADLGTLERIESPSMSAETFDTIARAIRDRDRHGPVLLSGVGKLGDRDALAQAADRLLDLEDVTTTFVYGIMDGTIYVSARARGTDVDLGETLRDAFGQIGSAGGHADMAGAQISLGLLDDIDADDDSLSAVVDSIVTERFLDAVESRTNRVVRGVLPDGFHGFDDEDLAVEDDTADERATGESEADGDDGDGGTDDDSRDDGPT